MGLPGRRVAPCGRLEEERKLRGSKIRVRRPRTRGRHPYQVHSRFWASTLTHPPFSRRELRHSWSSEAPSRKRESIADVEHHSSVRASKVQSGQESSPEGRVQAETLVGEATEA